MEAEGSASMTVTLFAQEEAEFMSLGHLCLLAAEPRRSMLRAAAGGERFPATCPVLGPELWLHLEALTSAPDSVRL